MGKTAILAVRIIGDSKGAEKALGDTQTATGKLEGALGKMAVPAAAALGALTLVGKSAVDSASRTQQAMGALDSVFGDNADVVKGWAADAAKAVGLSKSQYGEFASVIGAQLNNLTGDADTALSGTKDLISLGADLAATFGGTTSDAVGALSAALRGEADPAERYGLALNQTQVNARLAEKGLDKLTGQALTAAKAQTVIELATEQAGGAMGQFARESDTAAGAQQIAAAQFENAKSALGEALLPAVAAVTSKLGSLTTIVTENSSVFLTLGGIIATVSGAILGLNAALKIYKATQQAVTTATKIFGIVSKAAWLTNPITLAVVAILAVVAAVVLLWNKSEAFRDAVMAVWGAIKTGAEAAWNAIKVVVGAVLAFATAYVKAYLAIVKAVWNGILTAARAVWNAIKALVNLTIQGITLYVRAYLAVVKAVWNAISAAASAAWGAVRRTVQTVVEAVKSAVRSVSQVVSGVWNTIKSTTSSIWGKVSDAIKSALAPVRGIIDGIKGAFQGVIDTVQRLIDWIKRIKVPKIPGLDKLLGRSAPAAAAASRSFGTGPALAGAPMVAARVPTLAPGALAGGAGGDGVTIVIQGALDPVGVANQIRRILRTDARQRGGVIVGRTPRLEPV